MDIAKEIAVRAADIEQRIQVYLPKAEGYQHTIFEAMDYSVTAGGKRLRPMLMEASYEMFGGTDPKIVEPFMAAIECIHTYSLVHDDLPEMDDDAYRRGKLTTHKKFGQARGVLAGDALLNYAFEIVAKALVASSGDAKAAKAFEVLACKAGIYGMIGGQVVDVESEKKNETVERERLDFIYRLKTGALLEASLMVGAILAGADDAQVKKMEDAERSLDWRSRFRTIFWMSQVPWKYSANQSAVTRKIRRQLMCLLKELTKQNRMWRFFQRKR